MQGRAEKILTALGMMSGTSMDGIDLAVVRSDGEGLVERGAERHFPYQPAFRDRLERALETAKSITSRDQRPGGLEELERDLTLRHAEAYKEFCRLEGIQSGGIDVIGFHGQTVLHRPERALTVQLGDGRLLAQETGCDVVFDMRANDMVHGGQGAPLVPVYHAALAAAQGTLKRPAAFVNIGGLSNITYVGTEGELSAFDCGPGNALIDQWMQSEAGIPYDAGGAIGSEGGVVLQVLEHYMAESFFEQPVPKSLDRNDFLPLEPGSLPLADGARTLAMVTARSIYRATEHLPRKPATWVLCGGGRLNRNILADLMRLCEPDRATVIAAEDAGFNGDSMEAEAWAYLAIRSLKGLPLTFPETTGCRKPVTGGILAKAGK